MKQNIFTNFINGMKIHIKEMQNKAQAKREYDLTHCPNCDSTNIDSDYYWPECYDCGWFWDRNLAMC